MSQTKTDISTLFASFKERLSQAKTHEELLLIRKEFLSRNGSITQLSKLLKSTPPDQRREIGPLVTQTKQEANALYEAALQTLSEQKHTAEDKQAQTFDVTAYAPKTLAGNLHIYTKVVAELTEIFQSMGFSYADGPEVETAYNNFEALNIPADHPAQDLHDTLWLSVPGYLLRTHTSNVQAHIMRTTTPPIAIFAPGRCYRNEATDATHDFMFMQGEVLYIDKKVSIANLLATARGFLRSFFNNTSLQIRVRPGYFPFVEPGLEIDLHCPFCTQGCSVCKHTQWIELLGAGLVHPNVLRAANIDPKVYSGFAFGFGIERLAMVKYGINDVRLFKSNKAHFLQQF